MRDDLYSPLSDRLAPCGPSLATRASEFSLQSIEDAALELGKDDIWHRCAASILPIIGASNYLSGLMTRDLPGFFELLSLAPETSLAKIFDEVESMRASIGVASPDLGSSEASLAYMCRLRQLKSKVHLLTALCDLGQVWKLDQVTMALTRFADGVTGVALALAVSEEKQKGRLIDFKDEGRGPLPGLFVLAMGKHGAGELNYSSDIDITFFCELELLPIAPQVEAQLFIDRLARRASAILNERTKDGYVFRVDLRLRPDPSSTPTVVSVGFALNYYESVGQNWERASYIKSRAIAGDLIEAKAFMAALTPFVWRRSLDYPAIADVHSIKRQIHIYKADQRLDAPGANLKLGAGGIREIEFFVQTQQLILGGRDPTLRSRRTLDALDSLRKAGHLAPAVAKELKQAYVKLRNWEHRIQMLNDEQTHTLPEDDENRLKIAYLSSFANLSRFDLAVSRTLRMVNGHYGELFSEDEALSSRFGSLVFTGVEDDPETIKTLKKMGFDDPEGVCSTIRSWHHGRIAATRSERARELFTRLVPKLLDALQETGNPSIAFTRFSSFFSNLTAGVQIQSLFLANTKLFSMVVEIMGFSPRLAHLLARYPTSFDAMLDAGFFDPIGDEIDALIEAEVKRVPYEIEAVMNALRRVCREQQFRIGMQIVNAKISTQAAGAAYARLADACIGYLSDLSLKEIETLGGKLEGQVAIIALGKLGSQEMTARSDLDLMTIYLPDNSFEGSSIKGWGAETYFSRFTHKLIAALSVQTHEGALYEIDMKLRPTGAKGPVAVSLASFENYYSKDADTWEFQALTRARVVWASSTGFAELIKLKLETVLRQNRDAGKTAQDVLDMRALMEKERPARNFWDFKLISGGQVDAEFAAQYLQLKYAGQGGPLRVGTLAALDAMQRTGLASAQHIEALSTGWRVQQSLAQIMRVCLDVNDDPSLEPETFQRRLARSVHTRRLDTLEKKLSEIRKKVREAFEQIIQV